ncbi:MAG: nicotinamide riboside transporter PnuC [Rhodanobacteraceae bacterium]|nr:MAG: nicotinamide riboside transporter PnuC [Rhodanobacteraceae bacterium]
MDWLELVAALVSVAAVWLTVLRRVVSCPVGIVSVILYAWVFIAARLYSDALLQGIFGVMIVYSWVYWKRHLDAGARVVVVPLARRSAVIHVLLGVACALALGYAMHRFTNAALPWLDSALTAFSLVAQWWQARRHVAAWWLWIIVDVIYVGEYVYKRLDITSVLYAGFVVLAVLGLRHWQRARDTAAPATAAVRTGG